MASIIAALQNSYSAKEVKSGYIAGHYGLEESIMECLNYISFSDADEHLKTESIMVFLHE